MLSIDFSSLMTKYSLLTGDDIAFLNGFFNDGEIQKELEKNEKKRKRYMRLVPLVVVGLLAAMYGLYFFVPQIGVGALIFGALAAGLLYHVFFDAVSDSVKEKILGKLTQKISKKISYSPKSLFFEENIQAIAENTKLIRHYDRLDFKQDSIKIDDREGGFVVTGVEFQTSQKHTDKKGRTSYRVNNHAYLMKVQFTNVKYKVQHSITLLADGTIRRQVASVLLISLPFLIVGIIAKNFVFSLFGLIPLAFGAYMYFQNKKTRVELENRDFEKEFDVHSEDQIEARKILTPDFMYRIHDYVNKIDPTRRYSLYFKDDYLYIKFDVSGGFLEISAWKSLLTNLTQYVEFYLEMKNISELASDLKLSMYDKDQVKKQAIKARQEDIQSSEARVNPLPTPAQKDPFFI